MIAGLAAMFAVWLWTPIAWTWYSFIGAGMTVAVAWVLSFVFAHGRRIGGAASHRRENLLRSAVWNPQS